MNNAVLVENKQYDIIVLGIIRKKLVKKVIYFCIYMKIEGEKRSMQLTLDLNKNGNYDTELYNLIANIPENFRLYYPEHKLDTPLGIYNTSIERVLKAFEEIVKNLNINYLKHLNDNCWETISSNHKELLDSIMSFIDDGYHIMKCFYAKSEVTANIIFADKWLEQINRAMIQNYKRNIKPYREKLAVIDNKIKHNHARYYNVECYHRFSENISSRSVGYYIGGIDENGTTMPDEDIHPLFNGKKTAISYNKDIPRLLANVYYISYYTAHVIGQIIYSQNNQTPINMEKKQSGFSERFENIFKQVNSIKKFYFPDEYNGSLTEFVIEDGSIIIRHASNQYLRKLYKPTTFELGQISRVGYAKSIQVVY